MKKSKKIIVYLCLFFLSFSIVTDFKKQETEAIVLVDDALFWVLGTLVLASGVVAISNLQVTDMGNQVYNKFKLDGFSDADLMSKTIDGVGTALKITSELKSAIDWVAENMDLTDKSVPIPVDGLSFFSTPSYPVVSDGSTGSVVFSFTASPGTHEIFLKSKGIVKASSKFTVSQTTTFYMRGQTYKDTMANRLIFNDSSYKNFNVLLQGPSNYNGWVGAQVEFVLSSGLSQVNEFTSIPYSNPVIKENYNPTFTNDNLTFEGREGYIPIPSTVPTDLPVSTELPLTWDDVKGNIIDLPVDDTIPGEDTGEGEIETPSGWGWLLDILKSILNAILSIPGAILDFFEIDWTLVGEHVVYDEIFKTKFKPFYDVIYLLQNINVNPSTHSGKFYMVIPPEMGGDGQEHCVLDLTVGNDYIVMARAFINASIWIGFLWYIIKLFSPNLDIG